MGEGSGERAAPPPQVNINVLQLFLLYVCNLQRNQQRALTGEQSNIFSE